MYNCRIVKDSVSPNGCRLTTFEITYPLIIHAEIMTHRVFSRNVASNRAIPVKKLIEAVRNEPFVPERFPKNQAGMQNSEWLEGDDHIAAEAQWLYARDQAVKFAENLQTLEVHKQISNRLLAPFLWTTAVITATEWSNFFSLRCHKDAQPEIQKIAYMMRDAYENSTPTKVEFYEWHLPYITEMDREYFVDKSKDVGALYPQEWVLDQCIKTSVGRCARVSYLTHGENNTPDKDVELCNRLIGNRHLSPTEHVATPIHLNEFCGNFRGWEQFRKSIKDESGSR